MPFTLNQLLAALTPERRSWIVEVCDPAGLADTLSIAGARAFDLAEENHLVFVKNESPELITALLASRARFVLARPEIVDALPAGFVVDRLLALTPRPRLMLALLTASFDAPAAVSLQRERIHPAARVAPSTVVAPGAVIGADVVIGPECVIGPNTVIDHAVIGARTRIDFNCSIGSDGFGYETDDETGEIVKIPHFGRVLIGEDVEISSNVAVDRGSLRDTILEDQVKVDNLVHIAHNCHIKRGAFIIANAMVGGSTTVGEYTWVAPSTSLINGITVGRCAMTGLGAVVVKSVEPNALVVGVPAKKLRDRFPEGHELL